jgi:predicted nuclease of predicted toxin-antitoxin system
MASGGAGNRIGRPVKLLVDMNLSPRWVAVLESAGFEAAHWSSLGAVDAIDTEIMAFAKTNDYVILTHDLDFSAILAASHGGKPSVLQIRAGDLNPDTIGPVVVQALGQMAEKLKQGALLSIDPKRTRLRLLPLSGKDDPC